MCSNSAQTQIEGEQQSGFSTMQNEAQQVFGQNSALYSNLLNAFTPILNAGPDQEGFSGTEKAALDTQSTAGVTTEYQNAEKAAREQYAGEGGGNEYIPSGQEAEIEADTAASAAGKESELQSQITEADYSTGRENWLAAEQGLEGAGSAFNPSISLDNAATGAGSAASTTATAIANSSNSWMGALGGMAGTAIGGWAGGGFKMPG